MEYGLWNFHGGIWTGGNNNFPPTETTSRNYYSTTNNEIETPTFLVTTPVNNDTINSFTTPDIQHNQMNLRTNLEFLTIKNTVPINNRVPPIILPGHQDEHLQAVALEGVTMTSDLVTEQRSIDGLSLTDSQIPSLLNHQPNPASNNSISHNNNTLIVNNNNNNNDKDDLSTLSKKDKPENERRDSEEGWEVNEQGANIKLENNCGVDYLFSQSYQHPMYCTTFSPVANNKREAGTSDETDEEDEEIDENVSQVKLIEDFQNNTSSMQNRSLGMSSIQNVGTQNFSKNGYECGECGLVAETRPSLKKHIGTYHSNSPTTDLCLGTFQKTSNKCPITSCSFRSSEKDEMEAHMARHVSGDYKLNGKKRVGPLTPQRVRYEREEYRCQICAYSCTVEKAFYKHLKIHSIGRQVNQVKISCVICGKDRSSEVDMNKHMKKHRDDRYFCCDICIFKTVQLKKLIQHRRMHTGEKPHLCPHCSYRSARRDNLRSHVRRVHKKENLFCDTFSPRGLQLTPTTSTATTTTTTTTTTSAATTPVSTSNANQVF